MGEEKHILRVCRKQADYAEQQGKGCNTEKIFPLGIICYTARSYDACGKKQTRRIMKKGFVKLRIVFQCHDVTAAVQCCQAGNHDDQHGDKPWRRWNIALVHRGLVICGSLQAGIKRCK